MAMSAKQKKEKLIVLGKSGSGKDFLMRNIAKLGLVIGLKSTTRPKRKNEVHMQTYDFMSEECFRDISERDGFIVSQSFTVTPEGRDPEIWHYGITRDEFLRAQAFIMTPAEFSNIDPETRKGCFVVYLDIDRSVREDRVLGRRDMNDSVKRRMDADDEDFKGFSDYDLRVTDPDFNAQDVYDLMD
jgi:guanylate kinase